LAPENEVIDALIPSTWPQETPAEWKFGCPNPRAAIETFRDFVRSLSDLQRQLGKSGVFSGVFAINPVNHEEIPIFFSEYVLGHYGTGAIMGVPAHDQRDLEFAHRYRLLIKPVIEPPIAWLREHYNPLSPLGISPGQFLRAIYGTPTPTLEQIERVSETSIPPSPELEHIAERLSQLSGEGKEFCEMCIGILIYVTAVPDPPAEMLELLRFCYVTDPQFFTKGFSPEAYIDEGRMINSTTDFLSVDGLSCTEAKEKITSWLEERGLGKRAINCKLRDWLFSRQRYWGEPFPIVWENGKHRALDEKELPVVPPPLDDYKPTGTGEPPLAKAKDWIRYSEKALRETNVMPQWAGSCWYYLRFCDPHNDKRFVGEEAERYWMGGPKPGGVDLYVGGTEHAVLHLLYARFWHKVLFDLGYLSKPEPFQRLVNQGIILGETEYFGFVFGSGSVEGFVSAEGVEQITDVSLVVKDNISAEDVADMKEATSHLTGIHKPTGRPVFGLRINEGEKHVDKRGEHFYLSGTTIRLEVRTAKMSKSRGNVINPDDVIDQYGADAFRCYEMFMGPLEQMKPWSMRGVEGVARFLARVWRLFMTENQAGEWELSAKLKDVDPDRAQQKITHATIKKVTEDIESFSFNTAISQMMIFVNAFTNVETIPVSAMRTFLILLNPFAPHISSELWERLAEFGDARGDVSQQSWPTYDERLLIEDEVEVVIQINGKLRDRVKMPIVATEEELKAVALSNPKVQDRIAGKAVRKVIVVPKKLVNIVVT
jgi:leucyl-tRNA synthetase